MQGPGELHDVCRKWRRRMDWRSKVKDKRKLGEIDSLEQIQRKITEFRQEKEQLKCHPCGQRGKLNQKENLLNFLQNGCQEESFLKEYVQVQVQGSGIVTHLQQKYSKLFLALLHSRPRQTLWSFHVICLQRHCIDARWEETIHCVQREVSWHQNVQPCTDKDLCIKVPAFIHYKYAAKAFQHRVKNVDRQQTLQNAGVIVVFGVDRMWEIGTVSAWPVKCSSTLQELQRPSKHPD